MAKVTSTQRKAVAKRTGDSSFPMETGAQVSSAINLRGQGKTKSRKQVLDLATAAVARLLRTGKISAETAERLRAKIAKAREVDRGEG